MKDNGTSADDLSEELEQEMLKGQFVETEDGKAFFGEKAYSLYMDLVMKHTDLMADCVMKER